MPSTLRLGNRGQEVVRLQNALNSSLTPSPNLRVDGVFGPRTEAAVRTFQQSNGLTVDGVAGPATWEALGSGSSSGVVHEAQRPPVDVPDAPWMAIARREVGQTEIRGARHNPRIIQYHATTGLRAQTDEIPWCSSFVNWCLRAASITGTNSAGAASWLRWGTSTTARPGAITVIHNPAMVNSGLSRTGNHVGFLVRETGSHYVLLGGNQSNQVRVSSYPKTRWRLRGYRWPSE